MCGIAGIAGKFDGALTADIDRMVDLVAYRGPDGRGTVVFPDKGVALGHRRLSIIDPHPTGAQPMATGDGRYHIVFNGEIYNYLEIRKDLEAFGHSFRSHSDTEVLLHAFRQWGIGCLDRLIGMFAFAIWDVLENELVAARDRLGKKPFYYASEGGALLFASEVKSILALRGGRSEVDTSLIDAYMSFGYVPGEKTLHRGIRRLLPGHYLKWSNGRLQVQKYWDFDFSQPADRGLAAHKLDVEGLLTDSINLRLRSDVPLGVFLSGGLDSSAVVSLLAPGAASGLKTFSVAYDFGREYDETPYAREVAKRFRTDHHEIFITPKDFLSFIPQFVWHMDEPVTEAAAISLYFVSKLARDHVVVCLSGEGSDELFAGYDFYAYNLAMERARQAVGGGAISFVADLGRKIGLHRKLQKYLQLASLPLEARYKGISSYEESIKAHLFSKDFLTTDGQPDPELGSFLESIFERSKEWDALSRLLYFDTKTWLVDDLLIKADRMSMATSIELRVPFLDHRLVEYAATVPSQYKLNGSNPKFLLKEVVKERLPQSIIKRKKMGFPTPLEVMFKGELYGYARETLLSSKALSRGYFDSKSVEQLLTSHHKGEKKNQREIWQLLVLEEWHKQFVC